MMTKEAFNSYLLITSCLSITFSLLLSLSACTKQIEIKVTRKNKVSFDFEELRNSVEILFQTGALEKPNRLTIKNNSIVLFSRGMTTLNTSIRQTTTEPLTLSRRTISHFYIIFSAP